MTVLQKNQKAAQQSLGRVSEQSLSFTVPPQVLRSISHVTPPAIIYDLDTVAQIIQEFQQELQIIPNAELYFAIKANRNSQVLKFLADLGLGADIASLVELEAAEIAGFSVISATAPGLSTPEIQYLLARDVQLDFSSVSQLQQWCSGLTARLSVQKIGLRLRCRVAKSETSPDQPTPWSRFGIDPSDPLLWKLLDQYPLEIVRLHVHAGDLHSALSVCEQFGWLAQTLDQFPAVNTLNLGGGWTFLYYRQRDQLQRALAIIAKVVKRLNTQRPEPLKLILEPGMLLLLMAGYLVTEVRAVDQYEKDVWTAVVNTSSWNLMAWTPRWIVAQSPARPGPTLKYDIAGCTCYEEDYFARHHLMPHVEVGDRLLINAAGAYVSSMARSLHGLPLPTEWTLIQGQLQPTRSQQP